MFVMELIFAFVEMTSKFELYTFIREIYCITGSSRYDERSFSEDDGEDLITLFINSMCELPAFTLNNPD